MNKAKYFSGIKGRDSSEEDYVSDIRSRFRDGLHDNGQLLSDMEAFYKDYVGEPPPLPAWKHPDDPNYFVPYTETIVDTIVSKFFLALFAHNPIISYEPEDADSVLSTKIVERLVHYQLNNRIPDVLKNLYLWVLNAVRDGTGIMMVSYDKQARTFSIDRVQLNPVTGEPMIDEETGELVIRPEIIEEVDYEGFKFDVLDMHDVVTDWNSVDTKNADMIVREYIDPEVYLSRIDSEGYASLTEEQLESIVVNESAVRYRNDGTTASSHGAVSSTEGTTASRSKIELLHYFGTGYLTSSDESLQSVKITVLKKTPLGAKDFVVQSIPMPMRPIVTARFKPMAKQFAGRGVCHMIHDLNQNLNITYNAQVLNLSHSLHRGWIIGEDAGVRNEDELISRPGIRVHCENPALLKELVFAPMSADSFNAIEQTKDMMKDVTAAQDIVQGKARRQELATTATILDSNAKQRLELAVYMMAKDCLSDLGDVLRWGMRKTFDPNKKLTAKLTKDEVDRFGSELPEGVVDDNGFVSVTPEQLDGSMYATTKISAAEGDDRSKRQELIQLIQTMVSLGGQGWPTGEVDKQTGSPVMERLNISNAIRELYRLWGRHDFKAMIEKFVLPQQVSKQDEGQEKAVNKEPPGYGGAPSAKEAQAKLMQVLDQATVTE